MHQISRRTLQIAIGLTSLVASAHSQLNVFTNSYVPSDVSRDGSTMVVQTSGGWFYWTASTGIVNIGGVTTGRASVSDDGKKIGGSVTGKPNAYTTTGWTEMGIYDRSTSSWSAYGNLGYHSGVTASSGWDISGDGTKVLGQSYYNTTAAGSTAARVNPSVGTTVDGPLTNLDPNTVNNGRVQASSTDGTVLGGYDRGTNPGVIWVNGNLQAMSTVYNGNSVNLAAVEGISSNGRYVVGDGNSSTQGSAYLYDRITNTYKFAPNPYASNSEIATVSSVSNDGRYVFGRYLRAGFNPYIDAHIFVWDTTLGTITFFERYRNGERLQFERTVYVCTARDVW